MIAPFDIKPGDTFLMQPSWVVVAHLYVVLDVSETPVGVPIGLLANVTSMCPDADLSCVLRPSDDGMHPFIRHDSWVFYREMIEKDLDRFSNERRLEPMSTAVLRRIQQGAIRSRQTLPRFKTLIRTAII